MPADVTIGAAAASLSMLDNLYKLIQNAKKNGGEQLSTSEIIQSLPAEAFGVGKQITARLIALDEQMKRLKVDLDIPLQELETSYDWWKYKRYRAAKNALPEIEGLKNSIITLVDDVVAVFACAGAEELLSKSFTEALDEKTHLRDLADPAKPAREVLTGLIAYSEKITAQLGDL